MFGWIEGGLRWGGQKIQDIINERIDNNLYETGEVVVAKARQLAPVDTGALRDSIDYIILHNEGQGRSELRIMIGVSYGIYQEFGTRNIPPHPFIRPALLEARRIWGFDLNVNFAGTGYSAATGGPWHGLLATTGRGHRVAGFAASASPRWKPLTERQKLHVERKLIPSIKQWHRGNVKRARFTVG
jgi:HK97 gp10 family phage protein